MTTRTASTDLEVRSGWLNLIATLYLKIPYSKKNEINHYTSKDIKNYLNQRHRILCISHDSASDWLHAVPIPSLGLKLSDSHLRAICALRNGSLICQQHTCLCGEKVDQLGRHGLSCMKQIGRHPHHSHVNDLIKRALSHADIPSRLEPQGLDPNNCNLRPDGITLFPYKEGKCLVWDFTCVNTIARSHLKETCKQPGAVAKNAEKVKNDK